jgi:hypothetical protein
MGEFKITGGITPEDLDGVFQRYVKKMEKTRIRTRKTLRPSESISGTFTASSPSVMWEWSPMPVSKLLFFVHIGMMSYNDFLEILYPQARQYRGN